MEVALQTDPIPPQDDAITSLAKRIDAQGHNRAAGLAQAPKILYINYLLRFVSQARLHIPYDQAGPNSIGHDLI